MGRRGRGAVGSVVYAWYILGELVFNVMLSELSRKALMFLHGMFLGCVHDAF